MDDTLDVVYARQYTKYFVVSAITYFVLDYFSTLNLEIRHFWKSKGIIGSILFFVNRYLPVFYLPLRVYYYMNPGLPSQTCSTLNSVLGWMGSIGILASEIALLLRTYALWGNNRILLFILIAILVAVVVSEIVILKMFLGSVEFGHSPVPAFPGCLDIQHNNKSLFGILLILLNELVMFSLMIWIGVRKYRHSVTPLIVVLYRDGVVYFSLIFAMSLSNILVIGAGPTEYQTVLSTLQFLMHNVLASRIILHVRQVSTNKPDESMDVSRSIAFPAAESEQSTYC